MGWPSEHGGRDAGVHEQLIVLEEMARARAPGPVNAIGVANIAPAIMGYGTGAQQQRHLRPMLRGDEIWCQGMSEPDAGSDLASLRCRADRDGDDFVVSGQKTWNSNGDRADWCQLYVRTDPAAPKHQGITCLLVDMRTAGIEARPIRTMAGDAGFADVFFDGARVPLDAVLGEVGGGWAVATRTLSHERAGVASLYLNLRRKLDDLLAESAPTDDAVARDRLAQRHVDATLLELLGRRTLDAAAAGRPPGPEGSVVKLAWSRHEQALAETAVDVLGPAALGGEWARALLGVPLVLHRRWHQRGEQEPHRRTGARAAQVASAGVGVPKVFVVGQARSGTTWTRAILAHGPLITGPESHIFPRLHRYLVREPVDAEWHERVLVAFDEAAADRRLDRQGPQRWIDRSSFAALLDETIASDRSGDAAAKAVIEGVLTSYFRANGGGPGDRLVEKTPRHLRYADTILRWWPEARIIEMVRDGRDVCLSLRAKAEHRIWAAGELDEQIQQWAESIRIGRRLSTRPEAEDRWLTVRYEDVSADPRGEVGRMFGFLDVPFDDSSVDQVVAATDIEQMRRPCNRHHVRTGVAGAWRTELTDAEKARCLELAGAELRTMGYDTTG